MINRSQNEYAPDVVSTPGETVAEALNEHLMTQAELAERTGRPKKTINEIIKGKAAITPETALQLERVLGIPASFWNNRERHYRVYLARKEEQKQLQVQMGWLREMPVQHMINRGWVRKCEDKVDQLRELLGFFGVASPEQWRQMWMAPQAVFRRSPAFESAPCAVATWLRRGEIEARGISCMPFDRQRFQHALGLARKLTLKPPEVFEPELVRICAQAGVALVFLPEIPKSRVSGVARWLNPSKALIQLSLRYKSDDHLWFTFFHEAGHILLHGKREVFVDVEGMKNEKEDEANRFAANKLIPPLQYRQLLDTAPFSKSKLKSFARQADIAPGIVVGRLQHDGCLPYSYCNDLKQRLRLFEVS